VRFSFGSFLGHFPWARLLFLGTGLGGGQKGCLQRAATARTADRKRTVHILAMISIGRTRVMNKQKKPPETHSRNNAYMISVIAPPSLL